MKEVCKIVEGLEKPHLLIADKFRHRASTLFASMDIPLEKRDAFYKHMGHSETINKEVYQCPLAVKEITEVGKFFDNIDNDKDPAVQNPVEFTKDAPLGEEDLVEMIEDAPLNEENSVESELKLDRSFSNTGQIEVCTGHIDSIHTNTKDIPVRNEAIPSKGRRYVKWTDEDWTLVKNHFKSAIEDLSTNGVKGPLPGKSVIVGFLREHAILGSLEEKEKVAILKAKLFNERTKYRRACQFSAI